MPSPTSGDLDLATFLGTIELAVGAIYASAAAKLSDRSAISLVQTFGAHHQDHARSWLAVAGDKAVRQPNARLLRTVSAQLTSPPTVLGAIADMEDSMAATYEYAMEHLLSDAHLELAASILPVEGQHATVFAKLVGRTLKVAIPRNYQTTDGFYDRATYG